jgi:hypothetical protein
MGSPAGLSARRSGSGISPQRYAALRYTALRYTVKRYRVSRVTMTS